MNKMSMEESYWRSNEGGMRWAGHVTYVGENKNVYILVGKHEKNKPFGMYNCRW
jgi:hypothetical protein